MLRNPTAAITTECIEDEYEKLQSAWKQQLNDMKNQPHQRVSNHDNAHFTLMHLFHSYLNQIWMDSQNMLQCAQSWNNDTNQKDAAFTMKVLGMHLMKQSLRTRQEFFQIVDEVSGTIDYFSMPSTATAVPAENPLCSSPSLSPVSSLLAPEPIPVKLTSSPSTPTISTYATLGYWQGDTTTTCKHAFTPGSNYSLYFPAEPNHKDSQQQHLSCHFCHEKLGLKKSFSADNFCTLISQTSSTCTNNSSDDEIESLGDDMAASKKLLMPDEDYDNDGDDDGICNYREKLLKYQLVSELHESSKVEIEDDRDNASISSCGSVTDELKMKRSTVSNNLLHQRLDSFSSYLPESVYSSDNCNCENNAMPRKKRYLSTFFNTNKTAENSAVKAGFRDKFRRYRKDRNALPRSLSSSLLQLFSPSSNKNNKRQQQAQI
ncbi:hypothetical protein BD408DRAFT_429723 [Parasitella parasitica]|nr:hypothetical protein BD408DRAFT_429723 [Parasitella parasitica]